MKWVIGCLRSFGTRQLEVGIGTCGYQLAFYQRHGFRVVGIDHGFFINNYPEPVFERRTQHFDMLRLRLELADCDGRPGMDLTRAGSSC